MFSIESNSFEVDAAATEHTAGPPGPGHLIRQWPHVPQGQAYVLSVV
jgi:hypothetical protein